MPSQSDYLKVLREAGLSEDQVSSLVAPISNSDRNKIGSVIESHLKHSIESDERVSDKEHKTEKLLGSANERMNSNANSLSRLLLARIIKRMRSTSLASDLEGKDVFAGVYPWPSFSGYVIERNNGYLILVYNNLLKIAQAAARILTTEGSVHEKAVRFAKLIVDSIENTSFIDPRGRTGSSEIPLFDVVDLAKATQVFLLLHELGHVALSHTGSTLSPSGTSVPSQGSKPEHQNEFDADAWACKAIVELSQIWSRGNAAFSGPKRKRNARKFSIQIGGDLFLQIGGLIADYQALKGSQVPDSHPPCSQRLERFQSAVPLSGADLEVRSDLQSIAETVKQIFRDEV